LWRWNDYALDPHTYLCSLFKFMDSQIPCCFYDNLTFMLGNISGGNQPLHANYENFNLSHTMLIQRRSHGRWKGWFTKFMGGGSRDLQRWFRKSPLPPPMRSPLDQHRVTQIEVSIVCMKRSVSTRYVPFMLSIYLWCSCKVLSTKAIYIYVLW
jgi:hypothetical protein